MKSNWPKLFSSLILLLVFIPITATQDNHCPSDQIFEVPASVNLEAESASEFKYVEAGLTVCPSYEVPCDGYLEEWQFIAVNPYIIGLHLAVFRPRGHPQSRMYDLVASTYLNALRTPQNMRQAWVYQPVRPPIAVRKHDVIGYFHDSFTTTSALLSLGNRRFQTFEYEKFSHNSSLTPCFVSLVDNSIFANNKVVEMAKAGVDWRMPGLKAIVAGRYDWAVEPPIELTGEIVERIEDIGSDRNFNVDYVMGKIKDEIVHHVKSEDESNELDHIDIDLSGEIGSRGIHIYHRNKAPSVAKNPIRHHSNSHSHVGFFKHHHSTVRKRPHMKTTVLPTTTPTTTTTMATTTTTTTTTTTATPSATTLETTMGMAEIAPTPVEAEPYEYEKPIYGRDDRKSLPSLCLLTPTALQMCHKATLRAFFDYRFGHCQLFYGCPPLNEGIENNFPSIGHCNQACSVNL